MRPGFDLWRGWNIVAQAFDRLKGALAMAGGDGKKKEEKKDPETGRDANQVGFTMKSHSMFGDFSLRAFLETCLDENSKRLARYDARLLRPMLVPSVVKTVVKVLPRQEDVEQARLRRPGRVSARGRSFVARGRAEFPRRARCRTHGSSVNSTRQGQAPGRDNHQEEDP